MTTFLPIGIGKVTSTGAGQVNSLVTRSQQANRVDIRALSTNAGTVWIGNNTVLSDGSMGGIPLAAGEVYNIELITDLVTIFGAFANNGDTLTFTYWQGDRN